MDHRPPAAQRIIRVLRMECPADQARITACLLPIFGAMDSMVAHSDGYSPRASCTIRTARSRTSGENLLFLFMAPFSQELEPPQNPGRFTPHKPPIWLNTPQSPRSTGSIKDRSETHRARSGRR